MLWRFLFHSTCHSFRRLQVYFSTFYSDSFSELVLISFAAFRRHLMRIIAAFHIAVCCYFFFRCAIHLIAKSNRKRPIKCTSSNSHWTAFAYDYLFAFFNQFYLLVVCIFFSFSHSLFISGSIVTCSFTIYTSLLQLVNLLCLCLFVWWLVQYKFFFHSLHLLIRDFFCESNLKCPT